MRFKNTHKFSPVALKKDLPELKDPFHISYDAIDEESLKDCIVDEAWWFEQEDRCKNGYEVEDAIEPGGDGFIDGLDCIWTNNNRDCYIKMLDLWIYDRKVKITGRHYFYLNFWPIYGKPAGKSYKTNMPPRFTDLDFEVAWCVENMEIKKTDESFLKGRQLGFSEKGGGMVLGWNYTFRPASVNIIVAGKDADADHTMQNVLRGLDYLKNTQFYKERAKGGDRSDYIKAKHTGSEVHSITAKDNPQALSRFSPHYVWYEEVGKWSRNLCLATKQFVDASLVTETEKTGFAIYIGTGGDMDAGAFDLQEIHYKPEANGVAAYTNIWERNESAVSTKSGYFAPAWKFKKLDKEGNSLRAESIAYLLNEFERRPQKDRYSYMTQQPLYAADAFLITAGLYFGEHKIKLLNDRRANIITDKNLQVESHYNIDWINPKKKWLGVTATASENGPFIIFEPPKKEIVGQDEFGEQKWETIEGLYKAGTDSYDKDEANTSASLGSCSILKTFYKTSEPANKFVARLTQRPLIEEGGSELFYENTAKLCMWYNATNLIEWSNVRIFDWYLRNGLEHLLKERPYFVTSTIIKDSKMNNKYGIDPSTKIHWLKMLSDYLDENSVAQMDDTYQIERLAKFRYEPRGKYNCDTTISSALCIVNMQDDLIEMETDREERVYKEEPMFSYRRSGNSFKIV